MSRITVFKTVFWKEAGREVSGKVKQILHDHIVVTASSGGEYIIRRDQVYMKKPEPKEDPNVTQSPINRLP
jgi:hypothetical protein